MSKKMLEKLNPLLGTTNPLDSNLPLKLRELFSAGFGAYEKGDPINGKRIKYGLYDFATLFFGDLFNELASAFFKLTLKLLKHNITVTTFIVPLLLLAGISKLCSFALFVTRFVASAATTLALSPLVVIFHLSCLGVNRILGRKKIVNENSTTPPPLTTNDSKKNIYLNDALKKSTEASVNDLLDKQNDWNVPKYQEAQPGVTIPGMQNLEDYTYKPVMWDDGDTAKAPSHKDFFSTEEQQNITDTVNFINNAYNNQTQQHQHPTHRCTDTKDNTSLLSELLPEEYLAPPAQ